MRATGASAKCPVLTWRLGVAKGHESRRALEEWDTGCRDAALEGSIPPIFLRYCYVKSGTSLLYVLRSPEPDMGHAGTRSKPTSRRERLGCWARLCGAGATDRRRLRWTDGRVKSRSSSGNATWRSARRCAGAAWGSRGRGSGGPGRGGERGAARSRGRAVCSSQRPSHPTPRFALRNVGGADVLRHLLRTHAPCIVWY
eukprot:2195924-Rhodomonas_salina.6